MATTGILVNDSGDIKIMNGNIVIGDCRADIVERLLNAIQGEFKFYPQLGIGAIKMLGGNWNINNLRVKLIEDLKRNNISYKKLIIENKEIKIEFE